MRTVTMIFQRVQIAVVCAAVAVFLVQMTNAYAAPVFDGSKATDSEIE